MIIRVLLISYLVFFVAQSFAIDKTGPNLQRQVLAALNGKNILFKDFSNISSDHPDYLVTVVLKSIRLDREQRYKDVIELLSSTQIQLKVLPLDEGDGTNRKLLVGTYKGFAFWRELTYLLLGKAYYGIHDYKNAIQSLVGVPKESIFYPFSTLELFWAYAGDSDLTNARKIHQISEALPLSVHGKLEASVQKAFLLTADGKYREAMKLAKNVADNPKAPMAIKLAAFKSFAESGFLFWDKNYLALGFKENIQILSDVLSFSKMIPKGSCDAECAFFIAEAWWNYASVHRVHDPIGNKDIIDQSLLKSDLSLSPYVNRSIKRKESFINEDAYFLSIVLAWEMGNPKLAIERSSYFDDFFPVGRYQEDVYQLLGDYYFEKKNYKASLRYYRSLVKIGNTEKSTYATYKAAWSFYNLGQKWSALRHLEQIIIGVNKSENKKLQELSILKETRRDLLLFMAELLPFDKALFELNYIGYSDAKLEKAIEDLGMTYKKIGQFRSSSDSFEHLLNKSLEAKDKNISFSKWLDELLDNKLRTREFVSLDLSLKKYYTQYQKLYGGEVPFDQAFYDYVSSLFLLIHREAKKTEEASTWKSLDSLYKFTDSNFFNRISFQLLYHGAQRFESIEEYSTAVKWYREASTKKDVLAMDAAVSALRIVKTLADQSSLNPKEYVKFENLIFKTSKWFLDTYPSTDQRHIADLLYVESLLKAQRYDDLVDFYVGLFKRDGPTKFNINKLKKIQGKYYATKQWREVFFLTKSVLRLEESKKWPITLLSQMYLVMQEAAFQNAFSIKDRDSSIPWYQTAIDINESTETTLRAWNNLLLLFNENDPFKTVISRFDRFEAHVSDLDKSKLSYESKELIYKTRIRAAAILIKMNYLFLGHRIEYMARLDRGELTKERRQFLNELFYRFNSSYGDVNRFSTPKDAELKRHLDFVTGNAERRKNAYNFKDPLGIYNFIDDYFAYYRNDRDEALKIFNQYKSLRNREELFAITSELFSFDRDKFQLSSPELEDDYTDKDLIKNIQLFDSNLRVLTKAIYQFIKTSSPKGKVDAACYLSDVRGAAQKYYSETLASAKERFKDWAALHKGLESKITLMDQSKIKEQNVCNNLKNEIALYYPINGKTGAFLYDLGIEKIGVEKSENIYRDVMASYSDSLDQIDQMIKRGIIAIAEMRAYSLNGDTRSIALALIRFKLGDTVGAASLLKSGKDDSSRIVLAALIKRNGGDYRKISDKISEYKGNSKLIKRLFGEIK